MILRASASFARSSASINELALVRGSMALCYLWFGALKFFPAASPAEGLAADTIGVLTFGAIAGRTAVVLLAVLECAIGAGLLIGRRNRVVVYAMLGHMACTFAPMVFFPELTFTNVPFGLTLVGQYIVKNFVFATAALLLLRPSRS